MSSLFKPGDLLKLEAWFYVYELIDDYGIVFYVGMSRDPAYRFRSHANPRHCDYAEYYRKRRVRRAVRDASKTL